LTAAELVQNDNYRTIRHAYEPNRLKSPELLDKIVDWEYDFKYSQDVTLADKQRHLVSDISKSVFKTSSKFDLDSKGKQTNFDNLIRENVVQKTLEADSLTFVEGMRTNSQPNFLTRHQFKIEVAKRENWETCSAGDHK
jgi:hypothetical protein